MSRPDRWLLAIWGLLAVLLIVLCYFNPTHYLSPDSRHYLAMAGWLAGLNGGQYGHAATGWELDFPLGYPLLIAGVARLTGMSLLVASKGLNIGLAGVFLLVWRRRLGSRAAGWMGSVLLLGGNLRVLAYTWSEWTFLVVLLEGYWHCRRFVFADIHPTVPIRTWQVFWLIVLTISLFMLRYVGAWVVVAYALWRLDAYRRGGRALFRATGRTDLFYLGTTTLVVLGTFWVNSLLTPWPLGTERFYDVGETWPQKLLVLVLALVNEGLLLRDFIPNEPAQLVALGVVLQALLLGWVWRFLRLRQHTLPALTEPWRQWLAIWLVVSATYLAVVFGMRMVSPFAGPNARMMAVVSVPFQMGVAAWVSGWTNTTARCQLAGWWAVAVGCSWVQLLPQTDMWAKLSRFF